MRQRLITLIAVTALLIGGAVPAIARHGDGEAAAGNHGRGNGASAEVSDVDGDRRGPPETAKAYGWRIKDAYGLPFGLLKQCDPDFLPDEEGGVSEGYEAFDVTCGDALELVGDWPEDPGAMVFWTNNGIFAI